MSSKVIHEKFANIKIETVFQKKEIITISCNTSAKQALKILTDANYYTAPLFDEDKGVYTGLVTLGNLVSVLVNLFTKQAQKNGALLENHGFTEQDIHNIEKEFNDLHLKDVQVSNFFSLPLDASLLDLITSLANPEIERVPIVNENMKVVAMVSQRDIMVFLSKHVELLGEIGHKKVEELKNFNSTIVTTDEHTKTILTFSAMVTNKFSALGILGEEKEMLGIISFKDIGGCLRGLKSLLAPVHEYIKIIRLSSVKDINPTINCLATDTLEKALAKLVAVGVHRLFVRGAKSTSGHSFIGIISFHDVVRILAQS